eukprot:gnl/TRDRNA2_/TRDRNA2_111272_c0_seq1.p1 gnl/TRDRNA2_/TRDRNA2_111272_c0~~gnl/TRDRNA2_/TRDRNA2_111272_c0_seq1.p1  ORF type:complete len:448 (+),score=42.29 gnl/TRDRNA2_/TRDRNA2_111272_c0_seq1:3-1346(+)
MGRSYAHFVQQVIPYFVGVSPAAYAVCGAAGFVSAVTRISVAMTVIMLEISNDLSLLLPIMLTAGIAKFTGDTLTHPYFDMVLHMRHIPFVEPEPTVAFKQLRCYQVMQKPVVCLPVQVKVMDVLKVLSDTSHNGFPVVESMEEKKLHGMITRGHLEYMLKNIEEFLEDSDELAASPTTKHLRNHYLATYNTIHGRGNAVFDNMDPMHFGQILDLHRWMSRAPVTVHSLNTMEQAFVTIRTFGLRQLLVVNSDYILVGVITRHDVFHVQHDPECYDQHRIQHHEDFHRVRQRLRSEDSGELSPSDPSRSSSSRRLSVAVNANNTRVGGPQRWDSEREWASAGVAPARPALRRLSSSREWTSMRAGHSAESRSRAAPLLESSPEDGFGEDAANAQQAEAQPQPRPLPREQRRRSSLLERVREATSMRTPVARLQPGQQEEDGEVLYGG